MTFKNDIAEKVCFSVGHNIASLGFSIYDPSAKAVLPSTWLGCSHCGLTLEEIRAFSVPKKRNRKPKPEVIPQ